MSSVLEKVKFDPEGFLVDPMTWTREIGEAIAKREGMQLNARHWVVINFAREYFTQNGESPTPRNITKNTDVTTKELYELFPGGPAKLAAKLAGLHKPTGCI
ncbi:MAG: TusE/DsrC/DsvC family sulfur relay protein [Anaerolineaceae bacterium]|nr:TusE/DsrC/DsvC family sulfur relay protein [Anaerolineaceae bacterium]MBN2676638.1 TusE/DsrC/DsvC family sulfur relay protein [Anaerolineaceae bacterium]